MTGSPKISFHVLKLRFEVSTRAPRLRGHFSCHFQWSMRVADDFQTEIRLLGMESSPAFVREPEGNGCAEWFIRTLKENLLWVHPMGTIEELRLALLEFKDLYNNHRLIERHGNKTPAQLREEQLTLIQRAA